MVPMPANAKTINAADAVRPIILFSLVSRDDAVGVSSSSTKLSSSTVSGRFVACGVFRGIEPHA